MGIRIKKVIEIAKSNPIAAVSVPVSIGSLGVSIANLRGGIKSSKKKSDEVEALKDLTKSIDQVNYNITRRDVKFKKKTFSDFMDSVKNGALLGGAFGTAFLGGKELINKGPLRRSVSKLSPENARKAQGLKAKFDDRSNLQKTLIILGGSTIVGAALGAIVGAAKKISGVISHSEVHNNKLEKVVRNLSSKYREGSDFTRDPKTANLMKTKVCLVLSGDASEFRVLVNTINDEKLNNITNNILGSIPRISKIKSDQAANRYNEVTVTTINDKSQNIELVTEIAQKFIRAGYPVYLVEVG